MKKKLLFFACLLLLGGVSSAWATVTARLSGMNKVGDYYYPIYTLSESASINSYTSSNGGAPAIITDGTTLTFSHRGTVTLSSGETITGKKYAGNEVGFHALPTGIKMKNASGSTNTMNGFSDVVYRKQNENGFINNDTDYFPGFTITGVKSNAFVYYAYDNSSYSGSPLGANFLNDGENLTFTINDDNIAVAILTYYHNSGAEAIAVSSATLETEVRNREANNTMTFTIYDRSKKYYYQTLTSYTVVPESLTEATATLTGFAETSGYYYPVYTITATHDEDGTVNPTLTDGEGFDVATNVLTYTERTASETNVTITYGGVNTTVEVPASVKYKKTNYDLGAEATYNASLSSNSSGIPGFSDSATRKLIGKANTAGEYINGMNFAASYYGYLVSVGYGMTNNDNKKTANITISDMTDCYAVLTHKEGANSDYPKWASKDEVAESPVADVEGTITLSIRNKNNGSNGWDIPYVYTDIDIYQPVLATIVGTYSLNESSFTASDGKYYRQYTINATKDDTTYDNFTVAWKSGTATVEGKTVTYTGTETATVTLTDNDGSGTTYDLELPASVAYLRTAYYDFSQQSTFPSVTEKNASITMGGGFNNTVTRYDVTNKTALTIRDIILGAASYNWILCDGKAIYSSNASTITYRNGQVGEVVVLSYKLGANPSVDFDTQDTKHYVTTVTSTGDVSFSTKSKDSGYEAYTALAAYTPVSIATQSVTVSSGINMGTLVAPYPLDFSDNEGIKAYTATSTGKSGSAVVFTRINKVPAYTPVLIYKDGGATSDISFVNAEETDTPDASNMLKAGTGAAVPTTSDEGATNYILSKSSTKEVYGFFYANNAVVPDTKAYLQVTGTASSRLSVIFDDQETTGIGRVEGTTTKDATIYNLNGQRVNAPAKGLYIVNGKKIIIK